MYPHTGLESNLRKVYFKMIYQTTFLLHFKNKVCRCGILATTNRAYRGS